MNVSESLYARLAGNAGVAALVAARIYPVSLPQSPTLPAITYYMRSQPTEHAMGETASTVKRGVFVVQSWATTWSGAVALATAVSAALDAFAGRLGGATGARCWVTQINQLDLGDDVTQWKRRVLEFEVWEG